MNALDQHTEIAAASIGVAHLVAAVNAALHGASTTTIAAILRPASHGAGYGPWNELAQRISANATPDLARDLADVYRTLVHTPTEHGSPEIARYHRAERHARQLRARLLAPAAPGPSTSTPWVHLPGGPAWVLALVGDTPIIALRAAGAVVSTIHVQICPGRRERDGFNQQVRHLPPGVPLPAPARSLLDRVGVEPLTERAGITPVAALQVDGYDLAIIEHLDDRVRVAVYDQEPTRPFLRAERYFDTIRASTSTPSCQPTTPSPYR